MSERKALDYLRPSARPIKVEISDPHDVAFAQIVQDYVGGRSYDVALVGIPFDTCTLQRRGSKFGPTAVREMLSNANCYEAGLDVDISGARVADFGDIDVVQTNPQETHERVTKVLQAIHRLGPVPIAIGGDHSLTFPCIRALANNTGDRVGVINFDAHFDLREAMHGEINSGTSFRRLLTDLECPQVAPANIVEIGISGWYNSKRFADYARDQGISIYTSRDVHIKGPHYITSEALDRATDGVGVLYCSIDIDCLEAVYAPGTNVPSPGGLTSFQLLESVYMIAQHPKIAAFDIVEVAPTLESNCLTARIGAATVLNMIGGLMTQKMQSNAH